jgi:sigma-E factor negative regulatory protein RseB
MFTELSVLPNVPAERFRPVLADTGYRWLREGDIQSVSEYQPPRWQMGELPAGFAKLSEVVRPMRKDGPPVQHVMLSDGLAAVSVYVERAQTPASGKQLVGGSSMAGVNAYGISLPGLHVTVVGEVPLATVRAIASSVSVHAE